MCGWTELVDARVAVAQAWTYSDTSAVLPMHSRAHTHTHTMHACACMPHRFAMHMLQHARTHARILAGICRQDKQSPVAPSPLEAGARGAPGLARAGPSAPCASLARRLASCLPGPCACARAFALVRTRAGAHHRPCAKTQSSTRVAGAPHWRGACALRQNPRQDRNPTYRQNRAAAEVGRRLLAACPAPSEARSRADPGRLPLIPAHSSMSAHRDACMNAKPHARHICAASTHTASLDR